ncbi:MAG: hypothetical protein U0793_06710 [Gemmataceae bacterium]
MRARRLPLVLAFALLPGLLPGALFGQEHPRQPLLKLVPADFGFTLVVQDLRDQLERWGKSEWLKKMEETPLVQLVLKSDELRDLRKMLDDLPTYVGVDWPTLRDEVLGDAIVLAYRPPPPDKPKEENGLLLLRARRPELLGKIMSRLNELQKKSGELKDLEALEHRGVKYWRRVHEKNSHYYALKDGLLIVAASDELMRQLLDSTLKEPGENLWSRAIAKAAVPRSFVSLAVNPRAFDAELAKAGKDGDLFKTKFAPYWQALEALVLNVRMDDSVELRVSLQGKAKDSSVAAKRLFAPRPTSPLWAHFPKKSAILTVTGQIDLSILDGAWDDLWPPAARKMLLENLQKVVGPVLGLDVAKDLLPNLGPDWGVCVFGSDNPKNVPQVVFALAARPGDKDVNADQALYRGLQFLAGLAVFDYNRNHPDPIRIHTLHQDKVEVKCLVNDKAFPPGFQPAFALKDGYLLVATSPEAILRFHKEAAVSSSAESLFLRFSAKELSKQLKLHQDLLADQIAERNGIPRDAALEAIRAASLVFGVFDRFELATTSRDRELTVILRVTP